MLDNIRLKKARYFPDVQGTSLDSGEKVHTTDLCKGNVSIIAVLTTRISEVSFVIPPSFSRKKFLASVDKSRMLQMQTENFSAPSRAEFSTHPAFRYIQINLQENLLKNLLVSMFHKSIQKRIPSELWPTYLTSSQNMESVYILYPINFRFAPSLLTNVNMQLYAV